jgi:glutamine amidotransferase
MNSWMVVVCDTGMGNVFSVVRALEHASPRTKVVVSADPDAVARAERVVVPGQGAFRDCATALDRGLGAALREAIARGAPYLGICLGMQILFASSDEAPGCAGLGSFAGRVEKLRGGEDPAFGPLKIPHVGWNVARPTGEGAVMGSEPHHYYFVHSYAVVPADASVIRATTDYGHDFVSAVGRDNVVAVQFHPEKSQRAGLALLARFLSM